MSEVQRQLVVFDFDWSMADQDTDRYVMEVLAPDLRRKMKETKNEIQWTDSVAQSLQELHKRDVSKDQILRTLRNMPFHPAMVRAITDLKAKGKTTFFILSNANSVFISTILEDKGISHLFEEVVTNPAKWDTSGLLQLRRKIDPDGPQHTCSVGCSPNMCKGEEFEAFLARHAPDYDKVVYVGDGSNDFCPVRRLRARDVVLCRTHRGLQRRIEKEGNLKCQVKFWGGAWEIEEIFKTL